MKYTWLDLAKIYVVKHEGTKKRVSLSRVRIMMKDDLDYLLELFCSRGSIFRYDEEGEVWGVYVNSPKTKKRRSIWARLNDLGCKQVQLGDVEATWKFDAKHLPEVAEILRVTKRHKKRRKDA